MRPNIVTEAGLPTTVRQWWEGIPFLTSAIVVICGAIYLICLLIGYDSFYEICFLPSAIVSRFQAYRVFTSIVFHGSLLHVFFNMLALVPLGSELERIMGSVRLLYIVLLLATGNAILHLLVALLMDHNPFHPLQLMRECTIGFSGVLFSLIVIETNLSGVQMRSVFGLFNVPAYMYVWILLLVFQFLMSNVSFLGHLCGILSGFAYTHGLFNFLIPGSSFYSAIEASPLLFLVDNLCKETQIHIVHWRQYHRTLAYICKPKYTTQFILKKLVEELDFLDASETNFSSDKHKSRYPISWERKDSWFWNNR